MRTHVLAAADHVLGRHRQRLTAPKRHGVVQQPKIIAPKKLLPQVAEQPDEHARMRLRAHRACLPAGGRQNGAETGLGPRRGPRISSLAGLPTYCLDCGFFIAFFWWIRNVSSAPMYFISFRSSPALFLLYGFHHFFSWFNYFRSIGIVAIIFTCDK